jgi:hypothetical protein
VQAFLAVGALVGALLGGLLVPTEAWMRLRAVPLGRLVRGIGGAVAIGAALAWIVQPWWAPLGAIAGFVIGIRRLQRSRRYVAAEHLV